MDKESEKRVEYRKEKGKYVKKFSKKLLTKVRDYDIIADVNGASPSGKATDSDSVIT